MTKYGLFTLHKRIVLTVSRLEELNRLLLKHCNCLKYSATTKNHTEVAFDNYEELTAFSNFGGDKIASLKIEGSQTRLTSDPLVTIEFSPKAPFDKDVVRCYFRFSSNDNNTILKNDIHSFVDKAAEYNTSYLLCEWISLLGFIVLGVYPIVCHIGGEAFYQSSRGVFPVIMGIILSEIIALFLYCICSVFLWRRLFPQVVYAWGEEESKYQKLKSVRSNLFWVVLVGLIFTILGVVIS